MPDQLTIHLGHSPDPDDAFMFYGLATGKLNAAPYNFVHILQDIQTLNERAMKAELEVSAISLHAYPYVAKNYALMSCGCSMGDNYGPMLVAKKPMTIEQLKTARIAIPGTMTTAFLVASIALGKGFRNVVKPFDQILQYVEAGHADAGLIIHEGQLTYQNQGLVCCLDLGQWWQEKTGLPLPLGGNIVRRDLGMEHMLAVTRLLKESIRFSLDHRTEAVQHALRYARDMNTQLADKFVGMYVNDWTIDYGQRGRDAVNRLFDEGTAIGMVSKCTPVEFIS
ncbi:MAG: ABC transporter substrate-binding protein [Phycisphaerales bacterium]|nr:ABC transporter substrate-binding protein [Phycisphaerales bacterium]